MHDQERLTCPVVVSRVAEIDAANVEHVGEQLRAAFAPGVTAVITEMGLTVFCRTSGSRQLVAAYKRAMSWLKSEREIGNCRRSNRVRQNSEARCRASRPEQVAGL